MIVDIGVIGGKGLYVLISCDYPRVKKKRESFITQHSKCARNYAEQSETVQIIE